ncbi:MAG: macro domain-containing protein [Candidatus Sumerlaeaceae bacterium]|nr:macro domain-containing protein [Candidatus Sumerlaeaceae bacterium]
MTNNFEHAQSQACNDDSFQFLCVHQNEEEKEFAMDVEIIRGNIVETQVDAIVNAANTDLILGAGVAGAIRRAGGPTIQEECNNLAPIAVGEVAVTSAGNLPHRYVIHAATMTLQNPRTTADIIAACTRHALERADELGCESMAFPALGTGVAGLSLEDCAQAMLGTVFHARANRTWSSLRRVIFVLFDEEGERIFRQKMLRLQQGEGTAS